MDLPEIGQGLKGKRGGERLPSADRVDMKPIGLGIMPEIRSL